MSGPTGRGQLPLYLTVPDRCPYLPGRQERKLLARLEGESAQPLYDQLIRSGFRRSRDWAYRPRCETCSACRPVRVRIGDFVVGRSWRRISKRNAALRERRLDSSFREDHWKLFAAYLESRHGDGEMAGMAEDDYRDMVESSPVHSSLVEWRRPGGDLRAVCLVDEVADGLSAVYIFFDPGAARDSLGSFMVLRLVAHARRLGLSYLYLGYWIEGSPKMDYKARFRPLEVFGPEGWRLLPEPSES